MENKELRLTLSPQNAIPTAITLTPGDSLLITLADTTEPGSKASIGINPTFFAPPRENTGSTIPGHPNCHVGDCIDCHVVSCAIYQGYEEMP